ncbi:MAG TPA: hypothetical protein VF661_16900 [Actinomycetales bacterium]
MGHEVLSSHGETDLARSASEQRGGAALEVVELDDVDTAPPAPSSAPPTAPRRPWRRQVAQLGAVAVVAGVLGGALVQERAEDERAREQASTLAASVVVTELSQGPWERSDVRIQMTARVQNLGPAPVRVDPSPQIDGRSVGAGPDGSRMVPAGGALEVPVDLYVRCGARGLPPTESVSLTTADGRAHEVPLQYPFSSSPTRGACPGQGPSATDDVTAVLTGTTQGPVLRVVNRTLRPLLVRLEGGGNATPAQPFPTVRLTTRPQLPLVLGVGGRTDIALQLDSDVCVRDVELLRPVGTAVLAFRSEDGSYRSSRPIEGLEALVGAAAARACATGAAGQPGLVTTQ